MNTVFCKWIGSPGAAQRLHAVAIQGALQHREHAICGKPFRDAAFSIIYGVVLLIKGAATLNGATRLVANTQGTASVPLWT